MPSRQLAIVLCLSCLSPAVVAPAAAAPAETAAAKAAAAKAVALRAVERHRPRLVALSEEIWRFAETALAEHRSAAALADYAEAEGFAVERGVAGMPTAFVASFGSGRPVIGVLGEYDALPGLSQAAAAEKRPLEPGGAGHGCGHNLFGPGSLGAALAIKELIAAGELAGTIRYYGTPAEEAVGGKLYMAREGVFADLDAVLAWHPDLDTQADTGSSQAMVDFVVEFHGRAAHAAYDPWNGRSALDGAELFTFGLNLLREHVRPTVRMHYTISGGEVPNVVPEHARVWCWVRDSKRDGVETVMARVRQIVDGAALAAGVDARIRIQSGSYEMLVNPAGARLLHANLEWLGPVDFSPDEQDFARALQRQAGVEPVGADGTVRPFDPDPGPPEGGSTDVGDVSWVVPTLHLSVTTAPAGTPWHAWPVVAASGSPLGQRGMIYAAKALAATMVDLYLDPDALRAVRRDFEAATRDHVYEPYVPAGPPPLPSAD